MTSTTIGLPDRYRPLEQVGPDEQTATGVIRCWRAKDRVLNRDVAIRVHTPAGAAAHDWISRALTAGGLATPALAMVYDASEGTGDPQSPGGAAYVVNEWIEGETLTERLSRGPIPDRELRTVLRRLADGVAEAHRVGLAVGGLSPDNVVLRPNGLVGLRGVPAATGTVEGDIAALGNLLEIGLTGLVSGETARPVTGPADLVALVRRTHSPEPGQGLSSAAAMAALLAERPRTGPHAAQSGRDDADGRRRRLRDRRSEAAAPEAEEPAAELGPVGATLPPVPAVRPITSDDPGIAPAAIGGDTIDAGSVAPRFGAYAARHSGPPTSPARTAAPPLPGPAADDAEDDGIFAVLPEVGPDETFSGTGYDADLAEDGPAAEEKVRRHRVVVAGFWLLALAVVAVLAWYVGSSLMSVAGSVGGNHGSTPPVVSSPGNTAAAPPAAGAPLKIVSASVFDPQGDGSPDHPGQVTLSYDGNPSTAWKTVDYRGSAQFGNLKKGEGILYDLGSEQKIASVTVTSTSPGATVEARTGNDPHGSLDSFTTDAQGTVQGSTELHFTHAVSSRYVLVWITGLVPKDGAFSADLAEVVIHAAG
jgi:eukaryotic-like serine/threonine-protein kinase